MRIVRNPADGSDVRIYDTLEEMIKVGADTVRPPERLTVSQSAEKYRYLDNPGSFVGYWQNSKTPYLVEPMDTLTSTEYTGVIFVGPARTGKSDMFFNWLYHTAITDPANMMIVHMTQNVARDWSLDDLQKNLFFEGNTNRPTELGKQLLPGRANDNVFDKRFLSGMRLLVKHPTITELSGKTVPRVWVNDLDNMVQDVGGKGTPYDLAKKRTQTYKSHGMTVGEGSPAHPISDPAWRQSSPHEAPPAEGIMSLYNRGDRRRWYWRCPDCGSPFEPTFDRIKYNDAAKGSSDDMEVAESAHIVCTECGSIMLGDQQYDLNLGGKWIREGQLWLPDGTVTGKPRRSEIASFWLQGAAAAFTTWSELVLKYIRAEEEFERTGSESALYTTVTTDQGKPYTYRAQLSERTSDELRERAENWGGTPENPVVPEGVRFLMAMIDVQAGAKPAFVVHVFGIGSAGDIWHVDMFKIRYSEARFVEDGHPELIDPATYPEDWNCLHGKVIDRMYPLADGSGRMMKIKLVASDSGGAAAIRDQDRDPDKEGGSVSDSAYAFYREMRKEKRHLKFNLLKGSPSKTDTTPLRLSKGSNKAQMAGDIPLWLVNSNIVKDTTWNKLSRTEMAGRVRFPFWAPNWLYDQLTAEIRTDKGWQRITKHKKNEAFDLLAYCVAFLNHPDIRFQFIDWQKPPSWAEVWDRNTDVVTITEDGREIPQAFVTKRPKKSLRELARELG